MYYLNIHPLILGYNAYLFYLFNFQHGESILNLKGRIGGDAELSDRGWEVIFTLKFFFKNH